MFLCFSNFYYIFWTFKWTPCVVTLYDNSLFFIYVQMLVILTKSINRCFEKNPKFDMTPLLGGTDLVFSSLVHSFNWFVSLLWTHLCLLVAEMLKHFYKIERDFWCFLCTFLWISLGGWGSKGYIHLNNFIFWWWILFFIWLFQEPSYISSCLYLSASCICNKASC